MQERILQTAQLNQQLNVQPAAQAPDPKIEQTKAQIVALSSTTQQDMMKLQSMASSQNSHRPHA